MHRQLWDNIGKYFHPQKDHGLLTQILKNQLPSDVLPVLLLPGPDSNCLTQFPHDKKAILIILDGSWDNTKAMLNQNPGIKSLPRYSFPTNEFKGQFHCRPNLVSGNLSSLEAAAYALNILERRNVSNMIIAPLLKYNELQMAFLKCTKWNSK